MMARCHHDVMSKVSTWGYMLSQKPLKSPKIGFGDIAWKVGRKKPPKTYKFGQSVLDKTFSDKMLLSGETGQKQGNQQDASIT